MEALLAKLKAATEPSRTLDRSISVYLVESGKLESHPLLKDVPLYTSSIDAGATLIPDGYKWEVRSASKDRKAAAIVWNQNMMGGPSYQAETPFCALCMAALQAEDVWKNACAAFAAADDALAE